MIHASIFAYGPVNEREIRQYIASEKYDRLKAVSKTALAVYNGPLVSADFDVIVAPGNSYGWMTGGFDKGLVDAFGGALQNRVQHLILAKHQGELNVGDAIFLQIPNAGRDIYCAYAPTMRSPKSLPSGTDIPYMATRAALTETLKRLPYKDPIKVLIPLMGVGTGGQPVQRVLRQIHHALIRVNNPFLPKDLEEAEMIDKTITEL